MQIRRVIRPALAAFGLLVLPAIAAAHGGGLSSAQPERLQIPTWLFLLTGGSVVAASFLLTSFVTDRALIERIHRWKHTLPSPPSPARVVGKTLGLLGLGVVLVSGFFGPTDALQNAAILVVWVGWWAGYVMSIYLIGNSWPAVNPFRTLAEPLGDGRLDYPSSFRMWPAVVGLLGLIWIEVVSPLAENPRLLASVTVAYVLLTLVGSYLVGPDVWFRWVDPVSCVFRQYGKVAPIRPSGGKLELKYHGSNLATVELEDFSEAGLVVAIVWGTTYDGFVQTQLWWDFATAVVGVGVPAVLVYPAVLGLGYLLFLAIFWGGAKLVRSMAPTLLTEESVARLFAPSLLAIAAGYHLAHYLSYFFSLLPALLQSITSPLSSFEPLVLTAPAWMGALSIAFVLIGHLLAIWVAHGIAYEEFPSRTQAIRSQYPITVVMVVYTMASLWIVTQPSVSPPYI